MNPGKSTDGKIAYLNKVKVLLTILVILHHAFITYGAPGGWYYKEPTTNALALIPMTIFVVTNQSFFMGLFFLLSAYLVIPSYIRKPNGVFIADKLKRLGIPLVFYSTILSPILNYIVERYGEDQHMTFGQYMSGYHHWVDFGVLWFVAALLLFNLTFVVLNKVHAIHAGNFLFPSTHKIIFFGFVLGLITFIVRINFPIGKTLYPLGFQLGHFTQYIGMFVIGLIAYTNNWMNDIPFGKAKSFGTLALVLVFAIFPLIFYFKTSYDLPLVSFSGGWSWESLIFSLWEQLTGISIIFALLGFATKKWNGNNPAFNYLARLTFGVYIFHPLVLICLSVSIKTLQIDPIEKLILVAPIGVLTSFFVTSFLVKLPGFKQVI